MGRVQKTSNYDCRTIKGVEIMIITKKKFNEEIAKAINETQEKIYKEQSLRGEFGYIRQDMNTLERRIAELEKQANINSIENEITQIRPNY